LNLKKRFEHIELPAKLLDYFLRNNKSNINQGRAHIAEVTFLHKRVFRPKALLVNWHKPREKKALEHMAHGNVLWLDVMTHEGERISIINIHQATARRPDLQRRVNAHIQAKMNKSERRRRIMAGDLNAATSLTGYSISTKFYFEKVDSQFQEFIQRAGGSLIQSEAHTQRSDGWCIT
jgi:endonuclease/exonuclease/phosphatase family metal-dependent hydrolase